MDCCLFLLCFGGGIAGVLALDFDEPFFDDFVLDFDFEFDFVLGLFNLLISSKPFFDLDLYGLEDEGGVGGNFGDG